MAKITKPLFIEAHGVRVNIFTREDSGRYQYSVTLDGHHRKGSLKTTNLTTAKDNARKLAEKLAKAALNGMDPRDVTLGQLFDLYFKKRAPQMREQWVRQNQTRRDLFLAAWGESKRVVDISDTDVEQYSQLRRTGKLVPPGGKKGGIRDGSINGDFRWLSSVFNWAWRHRINGERAISENPLKGLDRPQEKNPYRPVASHQRFLATMEKAEKVDPMGRLGCALGLARYTGRREGAICAFRASDILRDTEAVRTALASEGLDENYADRWPNGAIHWRPDDDKQGFGNFSPLTSDIREILDEYLRMNPRLGDVPLFPAPKDPENSIRHDTMGRWLMKAETLAGAPKLKHGRWHPYRRLWATERKHLPDKDVAAAGGWRSEEALKLSYQKADPDTMLKVMNGV